MKTTNILLAMLIMMVPSANAVDLAFSSPAAPLAAGASATAGPDGAGEGVGFGHCDLLGTVCSVSAAAAAHYCVTATGGVGPFGAEMTVCVNTAGAAGGALGRRLATTVGAAFAEVTSQEAGGWRCEYLGPPRWINCWEVAPQTNVIAAMPCGFTETALNPSRPTDVSTLGQIHSCTATAVAAGSDRCYDAKAVAEARNDVWTSTVPPAEATGCGTRQEQQAGEHLMASLVAPQSAQAGVGLAGSPGEGLQTSRLVAAGELSDVDRLALFEGVTTRLRGNVATQLAGWSSQDPETANVIEAMKQSILEDLVVAAHNALTLETMVEITRLPGPEGA